EVPRNLRHVEASENRFLRLTIEQEPEGCFEATLRRVFARRQPFAQLSRHRDVVTRLALSLGDDHIESEGIALGGEPDLDHVALLAPGVRAPVVAWKGTLAVGPAFDKAETGPGAGRCLISSNLVTEQERQARLCGAPPIRREFDHLGREWPQADSGLSSIQNDSGLTQGPAGRPVTGSAWSRTGHQSHRRKWPGEWRLRASANGRR